MKKTADSLSRMLLLWCLATGAWAGVFSVDAPAALRAKYAAMDARLHTNQFNLPLVLDSAERPDRLTGDIYAVVEYPFVNVSAGLRNSDHWCDVMLLHINTKYCHAMVDVNGITLRVNVGKKTPEQLTDTTRLDFGYTVAAATPQYMAILLQASEGPLGTSDYRIELEAIAAGNAKTFLHLSYSYAVSFAGRMAMNAYLGTRGRDKVGFTVTGTQSDGQPLYIGGVRGLMERNTMRYYLAIDSFLDAIQASPAAPLEHSLQTWFTAVERYPRQLHEMERGEYLQMKRAEHRRQQKVY